MFNFKNRKLILDKNKLEDAKTKKGIDNSYEFCFSLNKGECFEIQINNDKKEYVFMGVNADSRNCIECNYVTRQRNTKEGERIILTIGANVKEFRKYHTDILGNKYYCDETEKNLLTIR